MRPYAHTHTCRWTYAKKNTQKIRRKHRTPSEKLTNRNAKSVPMSIHFSPLYAQRNHSLMYLLLITILTTGIVFFYPRVDLPGFCLLVFFLVGAAGRKRVEKKVATGRKQVEKTGLITTTHTINFFTPRYHHC